MRDPQKHADDLRNSIYAACALQPNELIVCSKCGQSVPRWFALMQHTNLADVLYVEALTRGLSIDQAVEWLARGHLTSAVYFTCMYCASEAPEYPADDENKEAFMLRTARRECDTCRSWLPVWFYAPHDHQCHSCAGRRKFKPFRAETKTEYENRFGLLLETETP